MFIDKADILIKSGHGGNGAVSFHREKYVMAGGPDGGDGGHGGNVVFVADKNINTLIDFKYKRKYFAESGENGSMNNSSGKSGLDITVKVPMGTVIRDKETGRTIADLFYDGETRVVLKGGRGGKGNARFAKPTRQAPEFSQHGVKTNEVWVTLELKTIADVGLVGFPNVGKSTLLSVLTNAKPKIANYHFTTLSPNLGVVKYYDDSFVIADIPGLIEGASTGAGLGHNFLRHIERVRLIVHIVDISGSEGRNPYEDFKAINKELKGYSAVLAEKTQIIAANKSDLLNDGTFLEQFQKKAKRKVIPISAATNFGLEALLDAVYKALKELPPLAPIATDGYSYDNANDSDDSFEIVTEKEGVYEIVGGLVRILERNVSLDNDESFRYFQRVLRDKGVIDKLYESGAKDGDTVIVGDIEFDFVD
ncbi:MAG: GTPase ObgE [Clostridiales bacterium]|jgi:GTP-binding protein|nr:GTPase ObgE [Clostridiales bacterium]